VNGVPLVYQDYRTISSETARMFETGKIILRHPARADGMRWMANRICLACGYEWRSEPRTQPCAQDWN
jgi:hypothetical protein